MQPTKFTLLTIVLAEYNNICCQLQPTTNSSFFYDENIKNKFLLISQVDKLSSHTTLKNVTFSHIGMIYAPSVCVCVCVALLRAVAATC